MVLTWTFTLDLTLLDPDLNPAQMAVAASDCFVRIYDRRMMGLANPAAAAAAPPAPALQLAPPHLTIGASLAVFAGRSRHVAAGDSRTPRLPF